jgi:hypothetical protein
VQVSHSKTPTAVTGGVCVFEHSACLHSAEACVVARAGRTAIYEAIRSSELVARKRGRKTIILADDLRLWIERLPRLERNPGQTWTQSDTGCARA